LRRVLDQHVYYVFDLTCPPVRLALPRGAVTALQGFARQERDLLPVPALLQRRAGEGEQLLDHLPSRDHAPGLHVQELRLALAEVVLPADMEVPSSNTTGSSKERSGAGGTKSCMVAFSPSTKTCPS
jgi:hypothetical protein